MGTLSICKLLGNGGRCDRNWILTAWRVFRYKHGGSSGVVDRIHEHGCGERGCGGAGPVVPGERADRSRSATPAAAAAAERLSIRSLTEDDASMDIVCDHPLGTSHTHAHTHTRTHTHTHTHTHINQTPPKLKLF